MEVVHPSYLTAERNTRSDKNGDVGNRRNRRTCPMVMGTRAACGPGRKPPKLPLAKALEYTRRHVPVSRLIVDLSLPPAQSLSMSPQLRR